MLTAARILAASRVIDSSSLRSVNLNLARHRLARSGHTWPTRFAVVAARRTSVLVKVDPSNAEEIETNAIEKHLRSSHIDGGHAASASKRQRQHSEETRKKISESMRGNRKSPETKKKMSIAKRGRSLSLGTRYAMYKSSKGRQHTKETRSKISQRMREVHAARKAARVPSAVPAATTDSAVRLPSEAGSRRAPPGLVLEKAVAEMMQLRHDIATFMSEYEEEHGMKPALEDTETASPELYAKFVRFVALQDYVRNFEDSLG